MDEPAAKEEELSCGELRLWLTNDMAASVRLLGRCYVTDPLRRRQLLRLLWTSTRFGGRWVCEFRRRLFAQGKRMEHARAHAPALQEEVQLCQPPQLQPCALRRAASLEKEGS
jgi:hypothetical protein